MVNLYLLTNRKYSLIHLLFFALQILGKSLLSKLIMYNRYICMKVSQLRQSVMFITLICPFKFPNMLLKLDGI